MLHIPSKNSKIIVNCEWNEWASTSDCSVTCGKGTQTQKRTKSVEEAAGGSCNGINQKTIQCSKEQCTSPGIQLLYMNILMVLV